MEIQYLLADPTKNITVLVTTFRGRCSRSWRRSC